MNKSRSIPDAQQTQPSTSSTSLFRRGFAVVSIVAFLFAAISPVVTVQAVTTTGPYAGKIIAYNGSGAGEHKVTICHAPPGHEGEKLVSNDVDASSIVNGAGHNIHQNHQYDIIPPFTYYVDKKATVTADFPGLNWSGDNIDLYDDGCVAGAVTPPDDTDDTVQVTIVKYLDGSLATAASADSTAFQMSASWSNAGTIADGSGSFSLGTTGFNNPNAYYATTAEMDAGANYSVSEVMGNGVADSCTDAGAEYALSGYSIGDTLAEAVAAASSTTAPNLTNIQEDQFIIVRNISCDEPVADGTVQVHITKYLDGQVATAVSANSTSFTMNVNWNDDNGGIGAGSGTFALDATNNYTTSTIEFQSGADYSFSEAINSTVATNCDGDEPYALAGYSIGNTLGDAISAATNTTAPSFTDLQSDRYVIVRNISCEEPAVDGTVQVHITKYLDGLVATDATANNATFTMNVNWNDDNGGIGAGSGTFTLDANNDYSTSTIEFQSGADYSFSEVINSTVAANCDGDEPYALVGYSIGNTLPEAVAAATSLTAPSFTDLQSDRYVVVRNTDCSAVTPDNTINVTIVKYLDGSVATAASTGGDSFAMQSSWSNAGTIADGSGTYSLSTSGFNNANAYYATTSEMNVGANYSTNEVMGNGVAASCTEQGAEYALAGYSVGDTLAEAAAAAVSSTSPSLTNIQEDQFIVVRNIRCGDVLGEEDIVCADAPVTLASGSNTLFRGLTTTAPGNLSDAAQYSSVNSAAVAAAPTGFPGAWDGISANANLSSATWVSNSATQPSATDEGNGLGTENSYRLYSHTFTVPADAINIDPVELYFAGDNFVTAFLNDSQLATSNFANVSQVTLPTLVAGQTYTLEFAVRNDALSNADNPSVGDYNPTGLIYQLTVDFDCAAPAQGGNGGGGGGGSSGSRSSNNDDDDGQVLGDTDFGPGLRMPDNGQVLGDTTTIPFDAGGSPEGSGRVLGDSLPVTGNSLEWLWAVLTALSLLIIPTIVSKKIKAGFTSVQ